MKKKLDDYTLLSLCLAGKTQSQIAEEYGLTLSQVCRRINAPKFQEQLSQHRKAILDSVLSTLTHASSEAVQTLVDLLHHDNGYLRFSAASRILSLVQDLCIQNDMLREIEAIKKSQNIANQDRGGMDREL
ncbi:MAG: hypothetical protein IJJ25_07420 [Lachnospiraceae bacterium]|nr:hypothetical protein [Lachnospiraceae bacterium]